MYLITSKDKSLNFLLLNVMQSYDLIKNKKNPNTSFKNYANSDRNKFIKKISKENMILIRLL